MPKDFTTTPDNIVWVPDREMSVRDWLAGLALAGMMDFACKAPMETDSQDGANKQLASSARLAYAFADAMLEARKEPTP